MFAAVSLLLGGCVVEYAVDTGDAGTTTSDDGCGQGTQLCGQACVNLQTDLDHCGGCGQACATDDVCDAGTCASECSEGRTRCGQVCADLSSDLAHCGECGESCDADGACVAGDCRDSCGDSCEEDDGEVCVAEVCVCRTGLTDCSGSCVDLMANANHCGECGRGCGDDVCLAGDCVSDGCGALTECSGACVDPMTNALHCGECGRVCDPDEACISGDCDDD